ncbi:phage tail sheath family protein [Robbsia andropogonis]|uniref:phage tail sheath family protein n=1 Tax=Robbsia andropogonis TaxID=28092 RepID=UPI000463561C|nr:phage tail sheath C-terminal domain-containing protein [Robbsia andropogonis]
MTNYKVPGVYVEEMKSVSLSVTSGETAIPVFAAKSEDFKYFKKDADGGDSYFEVESWLAVVHRANTLADGAFRTAMTGSAAARTVFASLLYRSLQAYFANGGGRAYVCEASQLEAVVPCLPDVTLLVQSGVGDELKGVQLTSVLKESVGLFVILDAGNGAIDMAPITREKINSELTMLGLTPVKNESAAFYYPWFKYGPDSSALVPPSAVMAGIYAKVDGERGVWKAPANIAVEGLSLARDVSDLDQAQLNTHTTPVNVIRRFGNGAPTVWGARVADSTSELKYVPVRRLFNALQRDIKRAMKLAVFEPNTSATWEKVRSSIDNYLHEIWRQGGLMGVKPEDAYRISIGRGITMSDDDIKQGKMIAEVAVAPARPAEFIILRFSEKLQKS